MRRKFGIEMTEETVAKGWPAFREVEWNLRKHGLTVDQIEWRWHDRIEFGGFLATYRAVFEVVE